MKCIRTLIIASMVATILCTPIAPMTNDAMAASKLTHAQQIMTKFAIPTGPVDGSFGPQTARGLCIFRYMSGLTVSRNNLDDTTYAKLTEYDRRYSSLNKLPAPTRHGQSTYLVAHQTCQAMVYVEWSSSRSNSYFKRVMAISTGKSGYTTPNGTYWLGGTQRGWWCSTLYPETCTDNADTDGRFGYMRNHPNKPKGWGNMYNFRTFAANGYGVHGSKSVPTSPASHGCVRVSLTNSDWMYDHVGNNGSTWFIVTGKF